MRRPRQRRLRDCGLVGGGLLALLAIALAASAAGCGTTELKADPAFLAAIPRSEAVNLELPEAPSEKAYGEVAELYRSTARFASDVNGAVAFWLHLVQVVVSLPPSQVSGDLHVWGPMPGEGLSSVDLRFTMTRNVDGAFEWSLEERRRNEPQASFVAVVTGTVEAGATFTTSRGTMRFDYDVTRTVDLTVVEQGALEIAYDVSLSGRDIAIEFLQFVGQDGGDPVDASYHYQAQIGAEGTFDFEAVTDLDRGTPDAALYPNQELLTHRTRWTAQGAGRTDVLVTGVDLTTRAIDEYCISECWDTSFGSVYYDVSQTSGGQTQHSPDGWGNVSECAYADFEATAP